MKLEAFFEVFDQLADAPDAVDKMRELVLQLAVQGKLVDQKRDDGNAAQLLAAISSERGTKAPMLRTPSEPASSDKNEQSFLIPPSWVWTQLGRIALQIQYGYTASADRNATEIRMLRITDIQNNRVDWPSVPGCQIESDEAEKYLLSQDDILIARTGGTIGKSFIVPATPIKSVFASYLIRVTPPRSMVPRYLKAFLESPLYWSQLRKMSAGTGQPNVNGQALGRLAIPLPPVAEQKRIVAKVDELMALCDRLAFQQQEREIQQTALGRASLARFAAAPNPANLPFLFHPSYDITPGDLRKSILTLAFQGKLVHQDENDESAKRLLSRIVAEKDELIHAGKMKRQRPIVVEVSPQSESTVPCGWVLTTLGEVAHKITDGTHQTPTYVSEGVPFISVKDFSGGNLDFSSTRFISHDEHAELYKRCDPRRGDILLGRIGTLGKAVLVDTDIEFSLFVSVALVRFSQKFIEPAFFRLLLNSPRTRLEFDRIKIGGATHTNKLNLGDMQTISVPLPPLSEQKRIVAKVDQLVAMVDELETQLKSSRTKAANLLSALVAELTSQPRRAPTPNSGIGLEAQALGSLTDGN